MNKTSAAVSPGKIKVEREKEGPTTGQILLRMFHTSKKSLLFISWIVANGFALYLLDPVRESLAVHFMNTGKGPGTSEGLSYFYTLVLMAGWQLMLAIAVLLWKHAKKQLTEEMKAGR